MKNATVVANAIKRELAHVTKRLESASAMMASRVTVVKNVSIDRTVENSDTAFLISGCSPGKYGRGCLQKCPRCDNANEEGSCDSATGACLCKTGFHGMRCESGEPRVFQCSRRLSIH